MSTISIPLSKLRISPLNVRHPIKGDVANDVHDLQASILAHGLMNPLVVHKLTKPKGTFGVIAGGRRLRALQGLLEDGRIPADHVVDCYESTADASSMTEMSIAENLVRVALKPTAEYEAFAKLAAAGVDEVAIAERFAVTVLHVRQRMRLGRLHPEILAAFDEHRITLDHAKAYAATEDQALQARVFAELSKGYTHYPHNIRNAIRGAGAALNTDNMLRVVGVAAYTAAGGQLEEDLFEGGFRVLHPGALSELYYAKVEEQQAALAATLPPTAAITISGTDLGRPIFASAEIEPEQRDRLTAIDKRADEIHDALEQIAQPAADDPSDWSDSETIVADKPENQGKVDELRAELDALQDEGERIHANAKVDLPDGPVVVYAEPALGGLVVRGYYRPKGYSEEGTLTGGASSAGTPPAASLDQPIGLGQCHGYGDPKPFVKAETGLTADALEVMRSHRRGILRGMMVDHREPYARTIAAMYLPFTALRTMLGEGRKYGDGANYAAELGVAQGSYQRAHPPTVTDLHDEVDRQPGASMWDAAVAQIKHAPWMEEKDLRKAFAMFRGLSDREMDLAGAVAAGLLLDRSLNAPGYRVPLHDEIATLIGVADREDVRRYITLDAAFFERLPKSRRLAAVAQISPSISKLISLEKPGDISGACASFFEGSDFARRRWKDDRRPDRPGPALASQLPRVQRGFGQAPSCRCHRRRRRAGGGMTPGEYIRRRREARGLSADVVEASCIAIGASYGGGGLDVPLFAIEGDAGDMISLRDATLLSEAIDFDLAVFGALTAGGPPPICRVCACSEFDPCEDPDMFSTCSWVEDDLCSAHAQQELAA